MSSDLNIEFINSKNPFLKPISKTSFLLKFFSNGFETSILLISNDFAWTLAVEKKYN